MFEELLRIVAVGEHVHRAAEPGIGAALGGEGRLRRAVLVEGVGGDAVFVHLVHVVGADLHLHALALRADDGGVERAVVVALGRRDVVLETLRHGRPGRVDDADRAVAVGDGVDEDAEGDDVGELLEGDGLALHLAIDRIGLLQPPVTSALMPSPASLRVSWVSISSTTRATASRWRERRWSSAS